MKMKRLVALTLGITMLASVVGCSGTETEVTTDTEVTTETESNESTGEETSTEPVTITAWAWDPAYNIVALNEAKEIYEAAHPEVTIEVVEMAKADIEQALNTMLSSGQTSELPDIVLIEDYNGAKYMNAYPDAFTPYSDAVDFSQIASPVDFMTVDGQTYGIPFGLATAGLYYRTDLIAEAGLTDADMENLTWSELIEIGVQIKEATGKDLLTFDPDDSSYIRMMMQSAGVWYTNEDGSANIKDNEVLKEAFRIIVEMQEAGMTKTSTGWTEYVGAFNSGEVAAVLTGCWITPSVMAAEDQSGLWKIAEMPRMDNIDESINASNLGGSSFYILSGTGNEVAAEQFLAETFVGSVELYDTILSESGISSVYSPAFVSDAYTEPQEFFGGQATNKDLTDWTAEVQAVPFGEYTWEADAVVSQALAQVLAGGDIDECLADAEAQFEMQIQ